MKSHEEGQENGKDKGKVQYLTNYQEAKIWMKEMIGIRVLPEGKTAGLKSITRKSLHFKSTRFHEILMEIAMMCQENSLTDFVGDLADFKVLLDSMSPVVRDLMSNSFKETRYT